MKEIARTLREFFSVLCQIQSSVWFHQEPKWKPSDHAWTTYSMLMGSWAPITERELRNMFPDRGTVDADFSRRRKFLYLPQLEKNSRFVPVLSLKCNLDETTANIKLRVFLVCRDEDEGDARLRGIGFRLEGPEGAGEGRHNFYHAQFIQNLETGLYAERGPNIEILHWLPETQPAFPLIAEDPLTLVLSLFLSLYDVRFCWSFVNEYQVPNLKSPLDKLTTRIQY